MKIESGSDLVLNLDLGVNLDDIVALEVKVFTTDKSQCITYKAEDIEGNSIYISASKLATLDSGVISYTYNYALPDDNFADAKYNKIGTKHTDYYFVNTGLVPEPDEYDYTYRFKFFPQTSTSYVGGNNGYWYHLNTALMIGCEDQYNDSNVQNWLVGSDKYEKVGITRVSKEDGIKVTQEGYYVLIGDRTEVGFKTTGKKDIDSQLLSPLIKGKVTGLSFKYAFFNADNRGALRIKLYKVLNGRYYQIDEKVLKVTVAEGNKVLSFDWLNNQWDAGDGGFMFTITNDKLSNLSEHSDRITIWGITLHLRYPEVTLERRVTFIHL